MEEATATPRIGCVPYLNARPLLEGLTYPVSELVPSALIEEFQADKLDAALLSSIDVISMTDPEVVDGVAIGSRGDVHSVILAYEGDLQGIERVTLDPASHTSNALLQIVLGEFQGIYPEYVQLTDKEVRFSQDLLPRLLIGDPAIAFRNRTSGTAVRYLDLGGEWYRHTGLPFIFAVWSLRNEYTNKKELSKMLRTAKASGLFNLSKIADRDPDPAFALRYLSESIRFDLGAEEKQGLRLFSKYLESYNIILSPSKEITYF
jgi:predicted solute-binding protein